MTQALHGGPASRAVIPEQVVPYVEAVSGLKARMFGSCVGYCGPEGEVVLVGYPLHSPRDGAALDGAVAEALRFCGAADMTVLAATRPSAAPDGAATTEDVFWSLPLPLPAPGQKLRNMFRRALREIRITQGGGDCWTAAHERIVEDFCAVRDLEDGSAYIFRRLGEYLERCGQARLFSAWTDDRLMGFAIGEYSSFSTAFYMFAFRKDAAGPDAPPPGTADALLAALAAEAENRGHTLLNLGLGINDGIAFFKKKWGAAPFLPCVTTTWPLRRRGGWLARLRALWGRRG